MSSHRHAATCAALLTVIPARAVLADLPAHPDEIVFPPLAFEPPQAQDFRHTLSNGIPVYLAPSHEFPLINVSFIFKGGDDLDPPGDAGLVGAMADMIRRGGTTTMSAEDLDEELDFLAAQVSTRAGATDTSASLNSLASNFDKSFGLFMDMVRNPGFQSNRLDLYKEEVIERMKQRNDHPGWILSREWRLLMYGPDHFEASLPTQTSIESITAGDLQLMHRRILNPGNLIIAVTGDFDERRMLDRLEVAVSGWQSGEPVPDPPAPTAQLVPGLYHIEKDIPQGRVNIGLRGIKRDDPDYFPLLVMNRILGGGGFTSRIVSRVRSDEGLAYNAGSRMSPRVYYPGEFQATFQSKNRTVALAIKIILEEIERIKTEPVTQEELDTARNALIETFPRTFESKPATLNVFVDDEMTRRDARYWQTYRDNVRAVTAQEVMRVARHDLRPQDMAILVVGKWDEIAPGDLEGRAAMAEFFGGQVTHLPLRDPLTLEPMEH